MDTCGHRFTAYTNNSTAQFEDLSIVASFPTPVVDADLQADNSAIFPLAMKTSIMPLEPNDYTYDIVADGANTIFELTLSNFDEELYSFAVWGRVFATDGLDEDLPVDELQIPTEQETAPPAEESPQVEGSTNAAEEILISRLMLVSVIAIISSLGRF